MATNDLETRSLRNRGESEMMSRFGIKEEDFVFAGRMSLLGEKKQISRIDTSLEEFNIYHAYFGDTITQTYGQILSLLKEVGLKDPTTMSRTGNITRFSFGNHSLFTYANRPQASG